MRKFEEPIANLSEAGPGKAGFHYYGPAWEAADGSKVVKEDDKKVQSADAPDAARCEPHVDTRDGFGNRKIRLGDLTRPSTI